MQRQCGSVDVVHAVAVCHDSRNQPAAARFLGMQAAPAWEAVSAASRKESCVSQEPVLSASSSDCGM